MVDVEIYSDLICPWCFIGKRRFEKALDQLGNAHDIRVTWRPFELNPGMPAAGIDRREYRIQKFGSWEYSQQLDAQVSQAGLGAGITFNYEDAQKTPNTLKGHMLVQYSQAEGKQDEIVEALFDAYFCKGKDIGDVDVLVEIASAIGLNTNAVAEYLNSNAALTQVTAEEQKGIKLGINGVPAFVVNGKLTFTGAQDPSTIAKVLSDLSGNSNSQ